MKKKKRFVNTVALKKEPELIPRSVIRIYLNRRLLRRLWKKPELTHKEYFLVVALERKIEGWENELRHAVSVVGRIKLKYNTPNTA